MNAEKINQFLCLNGIEFDTEIIGDSPEDRTFILPDLGEVHHNGLDWIYTRDGEMKPTLRIKSSRDLDTLYNLI